MKTKLLLIFGPSGTGKSVLISELNGLDRRFIYISPFMTRPLRKNEKDKISVSEFELDEMEKKGELLIVNELFGVRYGTPNTLILKAFREEMFPLIDWPIDRKHIMEKAFPNRLFSVYLEPPNLDCLSHRLNDRNNKLARFEEARYELESLKQGKYDDLIDLRIASEDNMQKSIAKRIYTAYLSSVKDLNGNNLNLN